MDAPVPEVQGAGSAGLGGSRRQFREILAPCIVPFTFGLRKLRELTSIRSANAMTKEKRELNSSSLGTGGSDKGAPSREGDVGCQLSGVETTRQGTG